MGVHGLAPFLQKTCPEVIRELPNRLRALSGKTIVIDGTLVTQRLHFSNMPYESKHILGWHRLLMELRENSVGVICVFDGKQRNEAKQAETDRRRAVRSLVLARSTMELQRARRLGRISDLLRHYASISPTDRTYHTPDSIRNALASVRAPFVASEDMSTRKHGGAHLGQSIPHSPSRPGGDRYSPPWNELDSWKLDSTLNHGREGISQALSSLSILQNSSGPNAEESQQLSPAQTPRVDSTEEPEVSLRHHDSKTNGPDWPASKASSLLSEAVVTAPQTREGFGDLEEYYCAYQRSVPLFSVSQKESVPFSSNHKPIKLATEENSSGSVDDRATQYAISRSQHEMTVEEGLIWDSFFQRQDIGAIAEQFEVLASRSKALCKSYEHRGTPPTNTTYTECKLIIEAMGVPHIECPPPFEAEALASSLVLNGFADYVASEDTDVLIYQAPLIRNLTNRTGTLTLISGAEVRERLGLPPRSFVDFALLLGTDFSHRLRGLGPRRAIELIRTHGSIERILEAQSKILPLNGEQSTARGTGTTGPISKRVYTPAPRATYAEYLLEVRRARQIFETLPPLPENLRLTLNTGREYDSTYVGEILAEYGLPRWSPEDEAVMLDLDTDYFADQIDPHQHLNFDETLASVLQDEFQEVFS